MFQQMKRLLHASLFVALPLVLVTILLHCTPSNQSIGYFESYGWPTYGIVKPFWMTPFSTYPTSQTSGYSRSARTLSAGRVMNRPGMNQNSIGYRRRRRR